MLGFASNPKADAALRRASEFKRTGEINQAVQELVRFRSYAEPENVIYPVESYLRLPLRPATMEMLLRGAAKIATASRNERPS